MLNILFSVDWAELWFMHYYNKDLKATVTKTYLNYTFWVLFFFK